MLPCNPPNPPNPQSATRCDAKSSVGDALRREIPSRRRAATRNPQSATRCDAKSPVGDALRREISSRRRAATRNPQSATRCDAKSSVGDALPRKTRRIYGKRARPGLNPCASCPASLHICCPICNHSVTFHQKDAGLTISRRRLTISRRRLTISRRSASPTEDFASQRVAD